MDGFTSQEQEDAGPSPQERWFTGCGWLAAHPSEPSDTRGVREWSLELDLATGRLVINAIHWSFGMESTITPDSSVDLVGPYAPPESGFHSAELGVAPRPVSDFC